MGFIHRLRRTPTVPDDAIAPMVGFRIEYGDETLFIADDGVLRLMGEGQAQRTAQEQFYILDMLAEEGRATVRRDGFAVPADEVARFSDDDAHILGIPPRFSGALHTRVRRWTASAGFGVDLEVEAGAHPTRPDRQGPVIQAGGRAYRLSVPLLQALRALEAHETLGPEARGENENVRLVAQLQAAQRLAREAWDDGARDPAFDLSLGALDRFTTVVPTKVGVTVEAQRDGSLAVEPDLGAAVDRRLLSTRWQQLDRDAQRDRLAEPTSAVLRAERTLVLLEPHQIAAVREVRKRQRIPAEHVATFLKAPGSYYDPELVDVDMAFSVRVAGLGVIAPMTFDEASTTGLDWFGGLTSVAPPEALVDAIQTPAEQASAERKVFEAWGQAESVVAVDERLIDISDHARVGQALEASRRRIGELCVAEPAEREPDLETPRVHVTVGMHIVDAVGIADQVRELARRASPRRPVDYARLRRTPYSHQVTGIEWMTGLMHAALDSASVDEARIQGALLADDMGLGKTFMTLAALAEAHRHERESGRQPLPVLAVMPVALLDNWLDEIRRAFDSAHGPFDDVVVLQGDGLAGYRLSGAARETAARVNDLDEDGMVRADRLHASLRVGPSWGAARLDRPGVLVLTTYEALRRYQVSLGRVDWGVVVLDEAQATKNPETLATRAAKGLKARFKLLATGTPVENTLRDFWSLMDTAQPGLLGTWAQFQREWVAPMAATSGEEHGHLGRALRDAVGEFMLRRVKEDHLEDLPAKHVHEYRYLMPSIQARRYDDVLADHRARSGAKGAALKTLHALAAVSLHPGLLAGPLDADPTTLEQSARTLVTVRPVLDQVRAADEKAIVFAKTKEVQRALALWLSQIYGLRIHIVNGDTAATGGGGDTRLAKIRDFESRDGFNVVIMSPLAVGVGLTVVGANHAIHLERHWNPAKEAQATDRVYRIGQKREVHVHYPVALHPDVDSFDLNLDRLLRTKTALKDAVVVPQDVGHYLERALGLT